MRVVFDTNIFVSALALPPGQAAFALERIIAERDILVLSKPILDELLRVLAVKFRRDLEDLARTAIYLDELSQMVVPIARIRELQDDADNRILECALTGRADAIVTGDRQMLALRHFRGIRIISLKTYLES